MTATTEHHRTVPDTPQLDELYRRDERYWLDAPRNRAARCPVTVLQLARWAVYCAVAGHTDAPASLAAQVAASLWLAEIARGAGVYAADPDRPDLLAARLSEQTGPLGDDPVDWADRWAANAVGDWLEFRGRPPGTDPVPEELAGTRAHAAAGHLRRVVGSFPYQRGAVALRAAGGLSAAGTRAWLGPGPTTGSGQWTAWEHGEYPPNGTAVDRLARNFRWDPETVEELFAGVDVLGLSGLPRSFDCRCAHAGHSRNWSLVGKHQLRVGDDLDRHLTELGFAAQVWTCDDCGMRKLFDHLGAWPLPLLGWPDGYRPRAAAPRLVRACVGLPYAKV